MIFLLATLVSHIAMMISLFGKLVSKFAKLFSQIAIMISLFGKLVSKFAKLFSQIAIMIYQLSIMISINENFNFIAANLWNMITTKKTMLPIIKLSIANQAEQNFSSNFQSTSITALCSQTIFVIFIFN